MIDNWRDILEGWVTDSKGKIRGFRITGENERRRRGIDVAGRPFLRNQRTGLRLSRSGRRKVRRVTKDSGLSVGTVAAVDSSAALALTGVSALTFPAIVKAKAIDTINRVTGAMPSPCCDIAAEWANGYVYISSAASKSIYRWRGRPSPPFRPTPASPPYFVSLWNPSNRSGHRVQAQPSRPSRRCHRCRPYHR